MLDNLFKALAITVANANKTQLQEQMDYLESIGYKRNYAVSLEDDIISITEDLKGQLVRLESDLEIEECEKQF